MDDHLKELVEDTPEVEAAEEVVEVEETGEEAPADEAEAPEAEPAKAPEPEATPAPEAKSETVPLAAVLAERKKRQELEAKLRELEQAQPKPDFYADPEGFVNQKLSQTKIELSAAMVEAQFPDFRDKLAVFMEEAAANPLLQAELESHPHPALYAYQQAKRIEDFKQLKDVDSYKAKLKAEIEAQVRAEYEAKANSKAALKASLPPDLTKARAPRAPEPVVDESLESILKR